jgi:hypothetical protein
LDELFQHDLRLKAVQGSSIDAFPESGGDLDEFLELGGGVTTRCKDGAKGGNALVGFKTFNDLRDRIVAIGDSNDTGGVGDGFEKG